MSDNCIHRCNVFDIDLDGLFDELFEKMQQPGQREAMDKAYHATPKELSEAATEAAKPAPQKSEVELIGEIQEIVKKSDLRNYGDGEREF